MLSVALSAFALALTGLLPVLNPLGSSLIARSMTPHLDDAARASLARAVARNCFAVLVVSVLVGSYLLAFFGISQAILRVGGGCVVGYAGWRLLHAPDVEEAPAMPPGNAQASAFYPITLPITVGPGSISVAIALNAEVVKRDLFAHFLGVGIAFGLLAFIIYLCMRYVCKVRQYIGDSGAHIADRLFAFILLCIGLQICWRGFVELGVLTA
jgi:multiple antibiotic resistance protein